MMSWDAWPENDDEEGRQNEEGDDNRNFDAGLTRTFFCHLTALDAHLIRLGMQHVGDADAQLGGLDEDGHEGGQIGHVAAVRHAPQRLAAGHSQAHLAHHARELTAERIVPLVAHTQHGRLEGKPRLHADREHIQRIGQRTFHLGLPFLCLAVEPHVGQEEAGQRANPCIAQHDHGRLVAACGEPPAERGQTDAWPAVAVP